MHKRTVRCFKTFANVYPGVYNVEVYYFTHEGFALKTFATCISCGELFVIDWENPRIANMIISEIAGDQNCPVCNVNLYQTIMEYPQNIKLSNGNIGKYQPTSVILPGNESILLEVYDLVPA